MKRSIFLVAAILFTVVVSGFAATSSLPVESLDKIRVKLKWKHQFQFAGYYAAIEKGYYRELGLDVELVEPKENEETFTGVLAEKYHFGISGSDIIVERGKGAKLIALAAIYQHSALSFLTSEQSGIKNIHQLVGRRVALEPHAAELNAYLKSESIHIDDLILFPHTYGVDDLMANKVDVISAYINDEPFNLKQAGLNYLIFSPQAGGIDFYGDILYTTEKQVTYYPKRVEKFLLASKKGWKYALENVEEIVELIRQKYSQRHSREHLLFEAAGAKKLILPHVVEIGYMNLGRWQHILEKYRSLGIIKNEVDLSAFLYQSGTPETSYIVLIVQILQILLVLLAIWFVIRFVRLNLSIEELDKRNYLIKKRLKKSRKRLARLMANLPGMAYTCKYDENWTMLFVSQGVFELSGYYPEELVKNKVLSYTSLILPEDRTAVHKAVKDSFHRNESFQITYRILCKNGQTKWVWEQGKFIANTSEFKNLKIEGFIADISESKKLESERENLIDELQTAAGEIKVLRGILPICANCKKIRDDKGYWNRIESYIQKHTDTEFTHGLCPDCMQKLYPDIDS